ncbi:hypothetical protein Trydic_g22215 [Trypoxylus dichotomus]
MKAEVYDTSQINQAPKPAQHSTIKRCRKPGKDFGPATRKSLRRKEDIETGTSFEAELVVFAFVCDNDSDNLLSNRFTNPIMDQS